MINQMTLFLLLISTSITLSAPSSPLIAWVGLELNSLMFIPLIKNKNNLSSHESMIKYFLIQSISSILFLTPTLFFHHTTLNLFTSFNMIIITFMTSTMLIKLAAAPFHFWLFPLINSISWLSFMLLMTWQKIAPLFMLTYLPTNPTILTSIIISTIIPPIMSLNQNSMKSILGYVSITHMAWLLTINSINTPLLYLYIFIYTANFLPIFYLLSCWNIIYLSQTLTLPNNQKFILFLLSLSLSGFPPLMMFLVKITLTSQLMKSLSLYFFTMFLLLASLLATYVYVYMNFPILMKNPHLLMKTYKSQPPLTFFLASMSLLFIPTMYILL